MINSIDGMSSAMMRTGSRQQQPPPPPGKEAFQAADSDGGGLVTGTELEAVVAGINEVADSSLSTEEVIGTYDADENGGLSGEEMMNLLADNGFGPPQGADGVTGEPPPPPPPTMEQALASYAANSGEKLTSLLINNLQDSENEPGSSNTLDTIS